MVEKLEEMREKDFPSLFEVPPSEIAAIFAYGNAATQIELNDFAKKLSYRRFADRDVTKAYAQWLEMLVDAFDSTQVESKLGQVRKRWILESLQKAIRNQQ